MLISVIHFLVFLFDHYSVPLSTGDAHCSCHGNQFKITAEFEELAYYFAFKGWICLNLKLNWNICFHHRRPPPPVSCNFLLSCVWIKLFLSCIGECSSSHSFSKFLFLFKDYLKENDSRLHHIWPISPSIEALSGAIIINSPNFFLRRITTWLVLGPQD